MRMVFSKHILKQLKDYRTSFSLAKRSMMMCVPSSYKRTEFCSIPQLKHGHILPISLETGIWRFLLKKNRSQTHRKFSKKTKGSLTFALGPSRATASLNWLGRLFAFLSSTVTGHAIFMLPCQGSSLITLKKVDQSGSC
jgi:hypothetical protein